jgi:hypothetical protein
MTLCTVTESMEHFKKLYGSITQQSVTFKSPSFWDMNLSIVAEITEGLKKPDGSSVHPKCTLQKSSRLGYDAVYPGWMYGTFVETRRQ